MRRILFTILLASAGCGPGSYRDFREQLTSSACDWAVRCGYASSADRAACPVDDLLAIFHDRGADRDAAEAIDVAASIDANRLRYDSVNAQDCLDAIAHAPCEPALAAREQRRGCNAVVSAHTATDQTCWADFECTGGRCVHVAGCAGICIAYASYGQPCVFDETAPVGMLCDPTVAFCGEETPGGRLVCQQKKPQGSYCDDTVQCSYDWTCRQNVCTDPVELDENQPCGGTEPCKEGTYCAPSGQCTSQHAQGEPCDAALGCKDGLACIGLSIAADSGQAVALGTCTPWLEVGAACNQPDPTTVSGCPADAPCTDGHCAVPTSTAAFSESCADRPCAVGLGCDVRKLCDFIAAGFGDCGGDRAMLCAAGLVCHPAGSDGIDRESCVPDGAQACFFPAMSD